MQLSSSCNGRQAFVRDGREYATLLIFVTPCEIFITDLEAIVERGCSLASLSLFLGSEACTRVSAVLLSLRMRLQGRRFERWWSCCKTGQPNGRAFGLCAWSRETGFVSPETPAAAIAQFHVSFLRFSRLASAPPKRRAQSIFGGVSLGGAFDIGEAFALIELGGKTDVESGVAEGGVRV